MTIKISGAAKNKTQKDLNKNKALGFSNRSNVLLLQSNT
jgi:hypothetical protein